MADPLDGVYCLNCRQFIPGNVADCPHCGAIRGTIPPPVVVAAARRQRYRRDRWLTAILVVCFLLATGSVVALLWNTVSRYEQEYGVDLQKPLPQETTQ